MEIAKVEIAAIEGAIAKADTNVVTDLTDLQLALVGGGIGDVVFG